MKTSKRLVGVCFGSVMIYGMVLAVLGPLLPSITETFGLNLAQTGTIFSADFSGFVVFTLFSGFLADKYGKKKILVINLFGAFAALLLLGLSRGFGEMLILMFFVGGCCGCLESLASAVLVDINPSKESFYVNSSQVFFGVGSVLSPILVGMALASGLMWKWSYIVLSILFFICFVILLSVKAENTPPAETIQFRHIRTIVVNRKVQLLCVCMFCYSGAETCSWGWLSTFLEKEAGFSVMWTSFGVSLLWAFIVAGRIGCLGILSKLDERKIVVSLAFVTAGGILALVLAESSILIWIAIGIMGVGYSAQWPLILAHGLKDWPGYSGTVASVMIGGTALGMTIIPWLVGQVGNTSGMRVAMAFSAIFLVIIALIFVYMIRSDTRKAQA